MRYLKKVLNKSIIVTLYLQIFRNGCFWNKRKWFSMKQKLFPNGNGALDVVEQLPWAKNTQKFQNQKLFQSFSNTGSRSRSKPKETLHKSSNTMFRYTGYSQKTEHLEKPLHTNRSQINTSMFVTWLKPSRGKQSMALAKQLLGAIYYAKEIKLHELLIIDQLAKDPICSLNRDHRPIGC